ncbi:MAG: rod shape-determining protein RodA [Candidatus Pacebacteria bacterium]|nr:rod shape-determining protein RodA [Candidatus Paceibacterota bacterium]MBP9780858.1 rod shape-determining protein RodA [Candidatus Paceibacterota bacterium]
MPLFLKKIKSTTTRGMDWLLVSAIIPLVGSGLITMKSFVGDGAYFEKQLLWIGISFTIFFILSTMDFRFLRRTDVLVTFFLAITGVLLILFVLGNTVKGAQSWFSFGGFAFQPSDIAKLIVILILAKYFSRRHVEIAHVKHLFVSALYAFIPFILVFLQPDFGSAMIIFFVWLGMTLVSGISKKHLAVVFGLGALAFVTLWLFVFQPYQKARISNFLNPYADIRGTGYNAYQSTIAVGSGQFLGKGVGYGTQSRLQFLPEYETDFIFAAFAEEWGFVGVTLLFICYGIVIWRILVTAKLGVTNFEMLFGMGVAIYLMSHFIINVGMNIGVMPVTGITLPFLSYGGSHLLTTFTALGILMGMRQYGLSTHRDSMKNEFLGI